jgi:transposase-like protein
MREEICQNYQKIDISAPQLYKWRKEIEKKQVVDG